jgi:hypothetical protein
VDLQVDRPALAKERGEGGAEALSPEAKLWLGVDIDRSLEVSAKELEARMGESGASEAAEREEAKDHLAESHEHAERQERLGQQGWGAQGRPGQKAKGPDPRAALMRRPSGPPKSGGSPSKASAASTSASYRSLSGIGSTNNKLAGEVARPEKPPDAFMLLKDAKDAGVLFTEDALREGHSEDQDDPALAEAVEECIRQCFGLRGILRIGPGQNDQHEPIIVVAITHGVTDVSLAKIPAVVRGFPTLVAIPFDLLPLKRER